MPGEKVAVIGHSFVNHLRDFVREDLFTDDSFGCGNGEVKFLVYRGLQTGSCGVSNVGCSCLAPL